MKRTVFYLKYFFYKPKASSYYKKILSTCLAPRVKIEEDSFKKFLKLFSYAFTNSRYYKKKYTESGIRLADIKTIEDIKHIPVLTKQEVKENLLDILTVPSSTAYLVKGSTGGSTGTPMQYYYDKRIPLEAFAWRYLHWWKLNPWDDGAYIWRMTRKGKLENLMNEFAWWPVKKLRLDAALLSDDNFNEFVKKIHEVKPKLIQGYVGAVHEFALFLDKNSIKIPSPSAVWVTSAPVSGYQRTLIERVFNAPLYNEYGSSEIPWIAAQCKEKKYLHINSEGRYLELNNIGNDGEGDIIITDLLNYAFPLLRYELGDRSKIINEKCNCGCNLPLIDEIKGRSGDVIIIPDLGKIDASYLTTIFDSYPNAIKGFQLIQRPDSSIILKVAPNYGYTQFETEIKTVYNNLNFLVQHKVKIELEYSEEIISDRGKTRYIIRET